MECKRCGDKTNGRKYCISCMKQMERYDRQFDFDATGQDFEVYG